MAIGAKHRHKYNAQPTVVEGIRFDSKKEAQRYVELKMLEKAGEIWDLQLQPTFVLQAPMRCWGLGEKRIGTYRADFAYDTKTGTIVEDVKGVKTPLYLWKKKHVEAQYGITIREI